jgi:hypothetical protein
MTKLLEDAIDQLRQLPDSMQDSVARAVFLQLQEEPEQGDLEAIAEGRREFEQGEFVTLEQLRHEMELDTPITADAV